MEDGMRIVCTGKGRHDVPLATVSFVVTTLNTDDPVFLSRGCLTVRATSQPDSLAHHLTGPELAEYNAGAGDFVAYPLEVRVLTLLVGKGRVRAHVFPVPTIGASTTRSFVCNLCGREERVTETQLRQVGALGVENLDLSQIR
jgi:hypothetical protein